MVSIERVGSFTTGWGESLVWDDERLVLWFADCASQRIHWIAEGDDQLHSLQAPSLPTGIVPTTDGRLLVVLKDGLHTLDPDSGRWDLVALYPEELGGRGNDACADLDGNVITGELNLGPADGSVWWWSAQDGWRELAKGISNTNGPAVTELEGTMTLLVGDTAADYYAFDYDPRGTVGPRRVFGDVQALGGHPDGATLDSDGGYWCALVAGRQLARFTSEGLDRTQELPLTNPTDVTFGGPELDRLYVTSIAGLPGGHEGAVLVIDGLPERGRPEPRAALA